VRKFSSTSWRKITSWENKTIPTPFPGLYPTRWQLVFKYVRDKKHHEYRYSGKPCKKVADIVYSLSLKVAGSFRLIEYDKAGPISETRGKTPSGLEFSVHDWNSRVYAFYYPQTWGSGLTLQPWKQKIYLKRITLEGKNFMVYSPLIKLTGTLELEEYRKWLTSNRSSLFV
jgi:hypothetical protein